MNFLDESENELADDVIFLKQMYAETYTKVADLRREFKRKMKSAKKKDANLMNYFMSMMPEEQSDFLDLSSLIKKFLNDKSVDVHKIRKLRDIYLKFQINLDKVTLNFLKKSNWTMSEQLSLYLHILDGVDFPEQIERINKLKRLSGHRKEFVQQSSSVDGLVRAKVLCNFLVKWLTKAENEYTDRNLEKSIEMQKKFNSRLKMVLNSLSNAKSQVVYETKYEARIGILRELIKTSQEEPKFQEFFENNPDFLNRQMTEVIPQKSFGGEQIPDLILVLQNENYIIVELEKPAFKLFTRKGDPTKELSHAQQQIRGYLAWAKEDKDFLRRRGLENLSAENTTGLVLIGATLSRDEKKKLESLNDTIRSSYVVKTFREVLEENEVCLQNLKKYPLKQNKC